MYKSEEVGRVRDRMVNISISFSGFKIRHINENCKLQYEDFQITKILNCYGNTQQQSLQYSNTTNGFLLNYRLLRKISQLRVNVNDLLQGKITPIKASRKQNAETQKWREMRVFVSYRRTEPVPKERCLYPVTMIRSYSLMLRIWKLLLIIVENNWKMLKHKFLLYAVRGSVYDLCSSLRVLQINNHPSNCLSGDHVTPSFRGRIVSEFRYAIGK